MTVKRPRTVTVEVVRGTVTQRETGRVVSVGEQVELPLEIAQTLVRKGYVKIVPTESNKEK